MLSHPLTKFDIQKYYQNEPKFNGVYSRNNSLKTKDTNHERIWIIRNKLDRFMRK